MFAWIVFESEERRDRVNKAVMVDPQLTGMAPDAIFDCMRTAYGGFEVIVNH